MIDPKLFTVERLLNTAFDDSSGNRDRWRKFAEIVPGYTPRPGAQPKVVVRYQESFLRYSKGPRQGFFWDTYGDDFLTAELALFALLQAPVPPFICKREQWDRWRKEEELAALSARVCAAEAALRLEELREHLTAISRIVRRTLACGQLEKLEDAKPYLVDEPPDAPRPPHLCGVQVRGRACMLPDDHEGEHTSWNCDPE